MIPTEQDNTRPDDSLVAQMHSEKTLSAFMDGESDLTDVDLCAIQIRQSWTTYHLIGDAMREPSALAPVSSAFSVRMSAALARESVHGQTARATVAARPPVARWRQALQAWPGLAVATAVASVVWVAQPLFGLEQGAQQTMAVVDTAPAKRGTAALDDARPEADYVSAHRQLAGPIAVRQVAFTAGAD
jgi:sigma-E factor negative regulatory protein RseA